VFHIFLVVIGLLKPPILRTKSSVVGYGESNLAIGKGCAQGLARISLPDAADRVPQFIREQRITTLQDQPRVEQIQSQPRALEDPCAVPQARTEGVI
jgi:hypothetical protein